MFNVSLVLSGSGTRYPVHVGALSRLQEAGFNIERICGISGGAIVAAAFASGYNAKNESDTGDSPLERLVLETLPGPNNLIDPHWFPWVFKPWGLIKGKRLLAKFREVFKPTFGDTSIPLYVGTTDLNMRTHAVYSSEEHPRQSIAKAVRMSMSIPGVFDAVEEGGHFFVDGGVTSNFPLDLFGTGDDVIGLRIRGPKPDGSIQKIRGLKDYASANIGSMMDAIDREHIEDAIFARTILLRTSASGMDFRMKPSDARAMIREGYAAVDKWLKESANPTSDE